MTQYRSREGEATAVDTKSQLTTLGSETAPGPLLVPAGVQRLSKIIIVSMGNFAAADATLGFIRLEGPGLPEGPESVVSGAEGTAVATGTGANRPAEVIPLDVNVTSGNEILIFGEMTSGDIGQMHFGVTLVFD